MAGQGQTDPVPGHPQWFLMCGYGASGKSTAARELGSQGAVVLDRDDLMIRIAGRDYESESYVRLLPAVTEYLYSLAHQISARGMSVVLDWNHWSRHRRDESARRARSAAADPVVVWVQTTVETAVARAATRRPDGLRETHELTADAVRHSARILEPPLEDERLEIRVIEPADSRRMDP